MRPILFTWRGISIPSYTALVYVAGIIGVMASNVAARHLRLDTARVYAATILLIAVSTVGARILFVLLRWRVFRQAPHSIWHTRQGGATNLGGILLALLVSAPLLQALQIPFFGFWDAACIAFLVALPVGRAGCLLQGCCNGRTTSGPLGMLLPDHHGIWRRRYPTQLLEAVWTVALLVALIAFDTPALFSGATFLSTLAGYGLGRLVLDTTRNPETRTRADRFVHFVAHALLVVVPLALVFSGFTS